MVMDNSTFVSIHVTIPFLFIPHLHLLGLCRDYIVGNADPFVVYYVKFQCKLLYLGNGVCKSERKDNAENNNIMVTNTLANQ